MIVQVPHFQGFVKKIWEDKIFEKILFNNPTYLNSKIIWVGLTLFKLLIIEGGNTLIHIFQLVTT